MKAPTEHVQVFHKYDSLITREVSCVSAAAYVLHGHVFVCCMMCRQRLRWRSS